MRNVRTTATAQQPHNTGTHTSALLAIRAAEGIAAGGAAAVAEHIGVTVLARGTAMGAVGTTVDDDTAAATAALGTTADDDMVALTTAALGTMVGDDTAVTSTITPSIIGPIETTVTTTADDDTATPTCRAGMAATVPAAITTTITVGEGMAEPAAAWATNL